MLNSDPRVVADFGDEWSSFDQRRLSASEAQTLFESYFRIFPWNELPKSAVGFDLGCGSGRWAFFVAPRVHALHCIDPAEKSLDAAHRMLANATNCDFHQATAETLSLPDGSQDFGYSLGVLHHVPDTEGALRAAVAKLKPGAPFLVYLYYRFDNRPLWFRALWRASDLVRRGISSLPGGAKKVACAAIAALVYFPLARAARVGEAAGVRISNFPLAYYRDRSFFVMRTDAHDRFATRLEKRYTRAEIAAMLESAGLERLEFSDAPPFWCCVGRRRSH